MPSVLEKRPPLLSASWQRLLGDLRRATACSFVSGGRWPVAKGPSCKLHSHRTLEVVHHPRGTGVTRLDDGQALHFSEGDTVIYAPDQLHDQTMSVPGEDVCLQVELPSSSAKLRGALRVGPIDDPVLTMEMESLAMPHLRPRDEASRALSFRVSAILCTLLEAAFEMPAAPLTVTEDHLRRAEAFLRRNFASIASLRDVAEHAGLSPDYLRHLFRAQRGKTMVRYLNELRVDRAKSLLAHSPIGIREIARQCGFRDIYYFSAVFHRLTRHSPGRYRLRARQKAHFLKTFPEGFASPFRGVYPAKGFAPPP